MPDDASRRQSDSSPDDVRRVAVALCASKEENGNEAEEEDRHRRSEREKRKENSVYTFVPDEDLKGQLLILFSIFVADGRIVFQFEKRLAGRIQRAAGHGAQR